MSRLAPSDETKIYKLRSAVRFDTTIAGFERMRWVRGHVSMIAPGRLFAEGMKTLRESRPISLWS